MNYKEPYIIAETAYTFEGDYNYLMEQTVSLPTSIDAIKYHMLFNIDEYMTKEHSVYPLLKTWMLSEKQWESILISAKSKGHDVIVLADDKSSVSFLEKKPQYVDAIEVHAACISDRSLLDRAIHFAINNNKRLYIGISGFEITELFDIVTYVKNTGLNDIVLMYGFQNYPTRIKDIQLNKIPILRELFGLTIGYADHTGQEEDGKIELIETAYVLGASIQEIHYSLRKEKRTDSVTALFGEDIEKIKKHLIIIKESIGNCDLRLNEGEKKYLNFRKVAAFSRNLSSGHVVTKSDIKYIRIENPRYQHKFLEDSSFAGRVLCKDVKQNEEILISDFI